MERRLFLARCAGAVAACFGFGAAIRPKQWETVGDAGKAIGDIRWRVPYWVRRVKTTDGTYISASYFSRTKRTIYMTADCKIYELIIDEQGIGRCLDPETMYEHA